MTNVSKHGFWILLGGDELFVAFRHYPWFREASIGQIVNVTRPAAHHLYWPDLDVDLAVESLTHPDKYPLVSRVRPSTPQRPVSRVTSVAEKPRNRATRPRR